MLRATKPHVRCFNKSLQTSYYESFLQTEKKQKNITLNNQKTYMNKADAV